MKKFLIIIRDNISDYDHATDGDIKNLVNEHLNWKGSLKENANFLAGDGLSGNGAVISEKGSSVERRR